jgi:hypothetical protein
MSKDTQDNVGMSYLDSNATKVFKNVLTAVGILIRLAISVLLDGHHSLQARQRTAVA